MASSVAQPLERQLAQIPGVAQMTSTSYLAPPRSHSVDLNRNIDWRRQRRAGRDQCRPAVKLPKNLPSPPTYRKVNPADSPILLLSADIGYPAADRSFRRRRRRACAAAQPDFRASRRSRSAASRNRRSGFRSIRPNWWQKACRWRRAQPDRHHHGRQPQRQYRWRHPRLHDLTPHQLTASKDWNDVIVAYRNGGPLRIRDIRPGRHRDLKTPKQAAWATAARRVLVVYNSPAPTS